MKFDIEYSVPGGTLRERKEYKTWKRAEHYVNKKAWKVKASHWMISLVKGE